MSVRYEYDFNNLILRENFKTSRLCHTANSENK